MHCSPLRGYGLARHKHRRTSIQSATFCTGKLGFFCKTTAKCSLGAERRPMTTIMVAPRMSCNPPPPWLSSTPGALIRGGPSVVRRYVSCGCFSGGRRHRGVVAPSATPRFPT
ncbi:hypothetical protein DL766_006736 [Monosporascus sp. MC13-8B]|uniref:Uncharacterized protein n=1 Tax=Monosporascus cannonballus TaxID=155416 RepID=A0ABY0GZY5_9PEZI|nr:hypothetical protein DL762_008727 [Monosporascus cannonballus]RYP01614.1 hypothetical protein DL763_000003 [Monosporascus cannonballus]RYP26387.1 hypothetical protein DL766_006736 [Monosporascus sp. MC13-8B]